MKTKGSLFCFRVNLQLETATSSKLNKQNFFVWLVLFVYFLNLYYHSKIFRFGKFGETPISVPEHLLIHWQCKVQFELNKSDIIVNILDDSLN